MTIARRTKLHDARPFVAGLCLLCLLPAYAAVTQETENDSEGGEQVPSSIDFVSPQIDVDAQGEIDEITVVAPRSLVIINRQIERADFALYNIANTLIDDPMYKTYCRRETSAGSNIKRRVCKPGYERELMSEAWEDERMMGRMGEGSFTFNYKLPEGEIRQHREKLKQKMIELAADNPKLAEAIYERAQLQRDYEAERKRRRQKDD